MKIFKRILLTILIVTLVAFLFRGWFYRHLVVYTTAGQRTNYPATDKTLIDYIEHNTKNTKEVDARTITKMALSLTSQQLNFTDHKNDNDPNKLIHSKNAHCIGYASFFASACNYLFKKSDLSDTWIARPQIGQLYFLGVNVHQYFNTPFFKDHDFVSIENKVTGEVFAVDPTVNDYLLIDFVTYRKGQ